MIQQVSIKNFKSLRDAQFGLERFTVFVGPNASGKSSVLQGLDVLCQTFHVDHPQNMDEGIWRNLSRGVKGHMELAAEIEGQWYRYRTHRPAQPTSSPATWSGDGRGVKQPPSDWKQWKLPPNREVPLPMSVLLHLESSNLVRPNPAAPDPRLMSPDGNGLHSALASMALNEPDSWQNLQADLRRIIPTVRRVRFTPTIPNRPVSLLFDTVGADNLDAQQVSEGTILVVGLLAALHASARPGLLLLDDLDRGLHPKAQMELISLLRGLMQTDPALQVIATTHSPYMLDCMEPGEVRMTYLRDDGSTACAALATHPQFEKWKEEMAPGELWSLLGEKWVAGGASTP